MSPAEKKYQEWRKGFQHASDKEVWDHLKTQQEQLKVQEAVVEALMSVLRDRDLVGGGE